MENRNSHIPAGRVRRAAVICLLAAVVLAGARWLVIGLEIDEEYALSISYRLLRGDRLFYSMFEPHQLSALPAAPLIAVFIALTGGTTGLLLFVRVVMLALRAGLAFWFYRTVRAPFGQTAGLLAAAALFLYTPKWFLGPDYTGQQLFFTVAAFLFLYEYTAGTRGRGRLWAVVAGAVCACFGYLAFPQTIVSAAVTFAALWVLGARAGESRILFVPRGAAVFALGCAICGAAFVGYVLTGIGLPELVARAQLILHDPQYGFTAAQRLAQLAAEVWSSIKFYARPVLFSAVACAVLYKLGRRGDWPLRFVCLADLAAILIETVRTVEYSSLDERFFMPALALTGVLVFRRCRGTPREALFWLGYLPGIIVYPVITRSSLIGLPATYMYLFWPALCALLGLAALPWRGGHTSARALLGALTLFLLVGRLWCVSVGGGRPGDIVNTQLRRIDTGAAAGIWAEQRTADMEEALCLALEPYAGKKVLQAIGEQRGCGFLAAEGTLRVGQASVISGTDSDPRFIQYYAELPDKLPDVVLYDDAEVRDMAEFHRWIEQNLPVRDRYTVTHGTASLQVLVIQ